MYNIDSEILPYVIRALDFHITKNMRAISVHVDKNNGCTISFLLSQKPSDNDLFLISDVQGMLSGDNLFNRVSTEISVNSKSPLTDIFLKGDRVFALNEDDSIPS